MEPTEMIEFLKQESLRVVLDNQQIRIIKHTCNNTNIYFWNGQNYTSYKNHDTNDPFYHSLLAMLHSIIRIGKKIADEYFPIWTKEDGLIPTN